MYNYIYMWRETLQNKYLVGLKFWSSWGVPKKNQNHTTRMIFYFLTINFTFLQKYPPRGPGACRQLGFVDGDWWMESLGSHFLVLNFLYNYMGYTSDIRIHIYTKWVKRSLVEEMGDWDAYILFRGICKHRPRAIHLLMFFLDRSCVLGFSVSLAISDFSD